MYFSLKGDNFDGNVFAMEAIEKGAKFSIVDDLEQKDIHDNVVYVENSLKALQDLSNHHRSLFDTKVIGITGSNGKTTTCLLYTSPSPRDKRQSRMPSSA